MGASKAPKLEFSRVARGRLDGNWWLSVLNPQIRAGPPHVLVGWSAGPAA